MIVDIHGAPGSQNGYDNSGQRTTPSWALDDENVARTVDTVAFVVKELGDSVSIIQLLNEAAGWAGDAFQKAIKQYWLDGYAAVRKAVGGRVKVMIGDAFQGINVSESSTLTVSYLTILQAWQGFMSYPDYQGVYMDWVCLHRRICILDLISNRFQHMYQVFSKPELARSFDDHINVSQFLIA